MKKIFNRIFKQKINNDNNIPDNILKDMEDYVKLVSIIQNKCYEFRIKYNIIPNAIFLPKNLIELLEMFSDLEGNLLTFKGLEIIQSIGCPFYVCLK